MSIQSMIERNQEFERDLAAVTTQQLIGAFMPILEQINEALQEIRNQSSNNDLLEKYHNYFMETYGCDPIATESIMDVDETT